MSNEKWKTATLDDVCEKMFSGGTPTTTEASFWNGQYNWLSSGETRNGFIYSTEKTITEDGVKKSSTRLALKHDVVMASAGQGKTRGQTSVLMTDTYINQSIIAIRPNERLHYKFLYYFLKSKYNELRVSSDASSIRGSITTQDLRKFIIQFPEYDEQIKIGNILSAYDNLIGNNNHRIAILEKMAQRLYREWFIHLRFSGHESVKMVESELGLIPEDWKISTPQSVTDYYIGGGWGKETSSASSLPAYVIRGTDIPRARINDVSECPLRYHTKSNLSSRILKDNDIVMEVSGGSKGQPVGRALLITRNLLENFDVPTMCASFCKLLRCKPTISSYYFYMWLKAIYDNGEIEKYQSQSTGIINFKFEYFLENALFVLPTNEVQRQFENFSKPLFEQINLLGAKNTNLRKTRDLLLPRLISGDIDVSEQPIPTEED
jgi:type I restriction enzyme S subunit